MSSAPPEGSLTRANPPPPIELSSGSVTATAAAAATAASAALPPVRYVSAAAFAAYGVPAAAAKVRFEPVVSITGYYAPSLARRAANGRKQGMHPLPTWVVVSARTPFPATSVSDRLLFALLTLSGRLGSNEKEPSEPARPRAEPPGPRPRGQRAGVGDQCVDAVFQRALSPYPDEGSGEEEPADGVLGTVRGQDQYRQEYVVPKG